MKPLLDALLRRRGNPQWDAVVWGTGIIALLALYPTALWPQLAGLVGFLCVTIFVNGPLAPLLPATYEPVLMVAGRVYPPLLVAVVGIVGTLYVEYLNYHLYRAALLHPRLEKARSSVVIRKTVALFERSPFLCVWLCSWSPLPFWAVRFLAPLSGYPVGRYLWATFLGRMPRLWFFASLGLVIPVSTHILVSLTVTMIVAAVIVAVRQRPRGYEGTRAALAPTLIPERID